jgi:thymidylate synthase ThyX
MEKRRKECKIYSVNKLIKTPFPRGGFQLSSQIKHRLSAPTLSVSLGAEDNARLLGTAETKPWIYWTIAVRLELADTLMCVGKPGRAAECGLGPLACRE